MRSDLDSTLTTRRGRRAALGLDRTVVAVVVAATLAACGSTTSDAPLTDDPSGRCPTALARLVDPRVAPTSELDLVVDGSGSFLRAEPEDQVYVVHQIGAAVDRAIHDRAGLRVLVFAASAGDAASVVACPVLAPRVHNEAARAAKTTQLREVAQREVVAAVLAGRPVMTRPGTSVVGGYVALADAPPLPVGTAAVPRTAVMLSDGVARPESGVPVDLSAFEQVSMYGVGHSDPPMSTTRVRRLSDRWRSWLLTHGARDPQVSTQAYAG